ncbi:MAG: flagellar motor protein MotB [Elusimicrobiales bacterium]|nr:flagellar motor protein MotB [Elusimicrobiales bacterium]
MIETKTTQLWMIPFADLMTCLVILFLALYGFSYALALDMEKAVAVMQGDLGVKEAERKFQEADAASRMERELKKQIEEGTLSMEVTTTMIKLTFPAPILFDSGSARLRPGAREMLAPVASGLKAMANQILVDGHTDATRVIGRKFSSNRELSLMRAFSVIELLAGEGVPPERFGAFGYGEYRPVAPNDTEEGRARNRRIEITVLREEKLS